MPLNKLYALLSLSFIIFKMVIVQGHSLEASESKDSPGAGILQGLLLVCSASRLLDQSEAENYR